MTKDNIRNFVIIAHIDHGKSTLADRFLEVTGAIEKRKMREQFLDQMELERERGITIKMQPVRMNYILNTNQYILNLIDTPGHIDFSYEVSRALKAVEGVILLVDATQGVQAQTIANVEMARALGLKIIPVINKIDLPTADVKEAKKEIHRLLYGGNVISSITDTVGNDSRNNIAASSINILEVSAKTGEGVEKILQKVIEKVPPPKCEFPDRPRALVFDFEYSPHQGVILYVRMLDGSVKKGDEVFLAQAKEKFIVGEVGVFAPARKQSSVLGAGEIGYVVTNIKKASIAVVGDSVVSANNSLASLSGYMQPKPVVWASIYTESQDDFDGLKQSLERLRLSDSSLVFEEETSGALGRGFRCGFLGMLHSEIITERIRREFGINLIIAVPTIAYKIFFIDGTEKEVYSPVFFPEQYQIKKIMEPWVDMKIIIPPEKIGITMQLLHDHEAEVGDTEQFGDARTMIKVNMPLRELMRNFFDDLKSATAGYGSLNYNVSEMREASAGHINRLDVFIAEEPVLAFSKIISRERIEQEAEDIVEKLRNLLPRELFVVKIQAKGLGRILASRSIPALKKDVTGYLYGGDRTRKMKLWQKQKKGKKRLKKMGKVEIPSEVFIKMMKR